ASAPGRKINGATPSGVAEAAVCVLAGRTLRGGAASGMRTPGEVFDAEDFLSCLADITWSRR
ncbi:hypothetical protein ACFVG7_29555, partial [Streptomyces sp. NPDC127112]